MSSKRLIRVAVLAGVLGLLACGSIEGPVSQGNDGAAMVPPVLAIPDSNSISLSEARGR